MPVSRPRVPGIRSKICEVPTLAEAKNARLKDRLDELKAEECDLLTENMELGRQKGDAARRKANLSMIDDIATEARSIQDYLSRAAWQPRERHLPQQGQQQKPQQQHQQRPHSSLNISGAGVRSLPCTPPASLDSATGVRQQQQHQCRYPSTYPTCT